MLEIFEDHILQQSQGHLSSNSSFSKREVTPMLPDNEFEWYKST